METRFLKTTGQSAPAISIPVFAVALLTTLLALLPACVFAGEERPWLPDLLEQESLTVVVTDSGLGGLSVAAALDGRFERLGIFRKVDLVFVNALFTEHGGYNALQSREEKVAVFSRALESMAKRYDPDLILVACNTLSVLVPDTGFAKHSPVPVTGIVEAGVEQIAVHLAGDSGARNIMFATQTTVDEGTHLEGLRRKGIGDEQFIAQACPQLTQYIERGFDGMDTELLIDAYVDEALSGMETSTGQLTVSFNCTHFAYSLAAWQLAFESRGIEVEAFLDPNTFMADFLLPAPLHQRHEQAEVTVRVVSMIPIQQRSIDSIGRWLDAVSPVSAAALRNYEQVNDLFEWRSLAEISTD